MQQNGEPQDDVDRLFGRLRTVEPPVDLTQRIMRALPAEPLPAPVATPVRAPAASRRENTGLWRWVAIAAGLALVLMSLHLGSSLDDSGALGVLGEATGDSQIFWSAPGEFFITFLEAVPWFDVIVTSAIFAVFWGSSSRAVDRVARNR